jgi:anti-sigma regulatory factor (Ser/Thr protein kinase)
MAEKAVPGVPQIGVTRRWRYRVGRERAAIGRLADRVESDLTAAGIAESARLGLATILDELLANVLMHARAVRGPVHVRLRSCKGEVVARVCYAAEAFDPTGRETPMLPSSIAEARSGGVGIAMVRALSREFAWRHARGINHLRVRIAG